MHGFQGVSGERFHNDRAEKVRCGNAIRLRSTEQVACQGRAHRGNWPKLPGCETMGKEVTGQEGVSWEIPGEEGKEGHTRKVPSWAGASGFRVLRKQKNRWACPGPLRALRFPDLEKELVPSQRNPYLSPFHGTNLLVVRKIWRNRMFEDNCFLRAVSYSTFIIQLLINSFCSSPQNQKLPHFQQSH